MECGRGKIVSHEMIGGSVSCPPELTSSYYKETIYMPSISEVSMPGQFLMLRSSLPRFPLFPRAFSILATDKKKGTISILYKVIGEGTLKMASLKKGNFLDILGPCGNPFPINVMNKKYILIGGGVGIPPILFFASKLLKEGIDFKVIYGGKTKRDILPIVDENLKDHLIITTEDGSSGIKGMVTDALKFNKTEVVYSCGPPAMLKNISRRCIKSGIKSYVSLEARMACGYGACLGCSIPVKAESGILYKRCCKEGPVFDSGEVAWEESDWM